MHAERLGWTRCGGGLQPREPEELAPQRRVGRSLNLRKQVEPLCENRPSGFLAAEACTRAASRFTWCKRWLKRTS